MSIPFAPLTAAPAPAEPGEEFPDWELDISIVESGPDADKLIRMTDDNCGKTCQSACVATCP
ncbi:FxLD family lanthipeptide [Spirillospora sp. NBC_00431]